MNRKNKSLKLPTEFKMKNISAFGGFSFQFPRRQSKELEPKNDRDDRQFLLSPLLLAADFVFARFVCHTIEFPPVLIHLKLTTTTARPPVYEFSSSPVPSHFPVSRSNSKFGTTDALHSSLNNSFPLCFIFPRFTFGIRARFFVFTSRSRFYPALY